MTGTKNYDVLISGGGMAGLTSALAMAECGYSVVLCAPRSPEDNRTTALLNDSIDYLQELGIWEDLSQKAYPLKIMRLVDGTSRLFRIQQTDFRSSEIGLDAFGYNIRNKDLIQTVAKRMNDFKNVDIFDAKTMTLETSDQNETRAILQPGKNVPKKLSAQFVIGADGRNSFVRKHFNHGERTWSYPQTAVIVDFGHEYSSGFASTEFHTETGPFTIVPQSDTSAGLVWLESPQNAENIVKLPKQELEELLESKMQSFLGKITVTGAAQSFPISGLSAKCFGDRNHALIGEAAHVFPPIGAQGFNLGIRDIRTLAAVLQQASGSDNRGHQYHLARKQDISLRTTGVDLLNRSLLSSFLPVQIARSAGLFALNKIPPLRKQAMKAGISPFVRG